MAGANLGAAKIDRSDDPSVFDPADDVRGEGRRAGVAGLHAVDGLGQIAQHSLR
jgi:hypothetical protein